MQPAHNRNPTGKNQYHDCPGPDDEAVKAHLIAYHYRGITSRKKISELLWDDYGIQMSATSVTRRRKQLGLQGSNIATKAIPDTVKRQLVLDQLAFDPTNKLGPRVVRNAIAAKTGVILTRDYVTSEMRLHNPKGFAIRDPGAKKIHRQPLVALGPHHEWSGDGHDKLAKLGFPIWGIRDVWSGKWLGLWVVPNNRLKVVVAYLYLILIESLGGMPIQTTTDCGSETGRIYALVNALREYFSPDLCVDGLPAHLFMRSIHNTTIERGWLRLRLQWGDNIKVHWEAGDGIYDPSDPRQYELVQWLWPKLIQQELDQLRDHFNNHRVRKDKNKILPSGMSPNVALSQYQRLGAENMLQRVDCAVVRQLREELGGEDLIRFVSLDYAAQAQASFDTLNVHELNMLNVWEIFRDMLPLM
ncbi:hypothetical protein K439DRAFT_1649981 [Ramaria rubella]|nr:hypothetical protein K439DRAFT_1649981 [Ramaria rubella]